ncbi:MAG: EF-P 5-aminopentanol modification-associated protein YfmF [Bacillota bacterium]
MSLSSLTEVLGNHKGRLVLWPTHKFSTLFLAVFLYRPLSRPAATHVSLLSKLLKRGCRRFPTSRELQAYLDDLYGAELTTGVTKIGEEQALYLLLELPIVGTCPLDEGMELLWELLGEPVLSEEHFCQEKANLHKELEDLKSDKSRYATIRCVQEMCRNEPFGVIEIGEEQDLQGACLSDVEGELSRLIENSRVELYVVGPVEPEAVQQAFDKHFQALPDRGTKLPAEVQLVNNESVREVLEYDLVQQAKVCVGLRTNVLPSDPLYPALTVYDGILGGFAHSKLFMTVREKASLAYYASSTLKPSKGIMVIQSGIDPSNYHRVVDIIFDQLEQMRKGNITPEELEWTRASIGNRLKASADSPKGQVFTEAELRSASMGWTLERRLRMLQAVTLDQVVEVARRVHPDTVYLLTCKP